MEETFVRQGINNFINEILLLLNLRKSSPKGDIMVFTVARSGLTYLSEIFNNVDRCRCITEPFSPAQIPTIKKYLKPRRRYLSLSERELSGLVKYVDNILKFSEYNHISLRSLLSLQSQKSKIKSNVSVIIFSKICNLSIDVTNYFNSKVIYFVRHPIPNSLSKLRNEWYNIKYGKKGGWYEYINVFLKDDLFCDNYLSPQMVKKGWEIIDYGSELEKYVLQWCLDNMVPFKNFANYSWLLISYEDLVQAPQKTIRNISNYCGFSIKEREAMLSRIGVPSKSIQYSEENKINLIRNNDTESLISGWRQKVSRNEIKNCFNILDEFGSDLYVRNSDMPNLKYSKYMTGIL